MKGRSFARAYTVVELMMAISVFATGVTGIIAMQRSTVSANRHARAVTVASGIAQAWVDQLAADSSLWRTDLTQTTWLGTVNAGGNNGAWQLPAASAPRAFGPTFDLFGNPAVAANDFCAHIRLTWLYRGDTGGIAGGGVIRTEVRVFWLRDGGNRVLNDCTAVAAGTVAAVGAATNNYHFVYQAGAAFQRQ